MSSVGGNEILEMEMMEPKITIDDVEPGTEARMIVGVDVQGGPPVKIQKFGEYGTHSGLFLHILKMLVAVVSLFITAGHGFEAQTIYKTFITLVSIYIFWSVILVVCGLYTIIGGGSRCDLATSETIRRWVLFEWVFGFALIGAAVSIVSVITSFSPSLICSRISSCLSNGIAALVAMLAYVISVITRIIMFEQYARLERDRYSR